MKAERYDLRRNNRLGAYACHWIRKRIREAVKEWRRGGQAGETRADRYVYDKPNAPAEEIEGPPADAEAARIAAEKKAADCADEISSDSGPEGSPLGLR